MRITYDREADAAYIYLTDARLAPGRDTIDVEVPDDATCEVFLDWKDGRLVGIEILDARDAIHQDLLDQAEDIADG
ncbi:DUF2283 domain-containing protein [uncultured Jatrophihabitans sp.]|uniref:DUF2283 domain-containing protein n=1 Tax=uncultured Jatrophihabitans sp. TaxID=1610747 RepID=UPI0035CAD94B